MKAIDDVMDGLMRIEVQVLRRTQSVFLVCGFVCLFLSALLGWVLAEFLSLSYLVTAEIGLCAVITFLTSAMLTKIVTGSERFVYYHHEIAILLVTAGLLRLIHQPVLPFLDITILGIGVFLFCGRIACLTVGCCHGKPHHWGVCYSEEHRAAGFTPYLVGVRLFPVQLLESLFVLFVVITGAALVLGESYRPGEAFAWYVIVYGAARFYFEFLRGDPDRPYFAGFSEAQWTSVILMGLVALGEFAGNLPAHSWHAGVALLIAVTMVVLFIKRKCNKADTYEILLAHHIMEVAGAVKAASICTCDQPQIPVGCTTLGYRISAGKVDTDKGRIHHYAFSREGGNMSEKAAQALSCLTLKLKHPDSTFEVLKGSEGVFHLLIRA